MSTESLTLASAIDRVRSLTAQEPHDPREVFDELQRVIDRLEAANQHVPPDLRQSAAELEGEIVEEFFDNLPV